MARRKSGSLGGAIFVISLVALTLMNSQGWSSYTLLQWSVVGLLILVTIYVLIRPSLGLLRLLRNGAVRRRLVRVARSNAPIDSMGWLEFEYYVAEWLTKRGYTNVRLTEHYDLGVDIVAKKDGVTWGVQVKHYSNLVGIEAVRQVVVALKKYKCDRAMVVTNSTYSRPAIELAKSQDCILIDGPKLA